MADGKILDLNSLEKGVFSLVLNETSTQKIVAEIKGLSEKNLSLPLTIVLSLDSNSGCVGTVFSDSIVDNQTVQFQSARPLDFKGFLPPTPRSVLLNGVLGGQEVQKLLSL